MTQVEDDKQAVDIPLDDIKNPDEDDDGNEQTEEEVYKPRSLKDVLLGTNLPAKHLIVVNITFIISFQIFVEFASYFIQKYFSLLFSVTFLIVPIVWGYAFYFSRPFLRKTATLQRTLNALMLGYFLDTGIYFIQWFIIYGIFYGIHELYLYTDRDYKILVFSLVGETIFEATFLEAIPEEILKYYIILQMSKVEPIPTRYGAIVYAIFATLGFIFFSGTLRILRVYWMSGDYPNDVLIGSVFWLVEALLTSTMQIVAGLWIGLNFIKRYFRAPDKEPLATWKIVTPSIILHAVYMSLVMVLYLLYKYDLLDWKLFILVCALATFAISVALLITLFRVKNLFVDPNLYVMLQPPVLDDEETATPDNQTTIN